MSGDKQENFFMDQMQKFDEKKSSYLSSPLKNSIKRMSLVSKRTPPEKYRQMKVNRNDHQIGQNNMTYEEHLSSTDRFESSFGNDENLRPQKDFFKTVKNQDYFLQKNLSQDHTQHTSSSIDESALTIQPAEYYNKKQYKTINITKSSKKAKKG